MQRILLGIMVLVAAAPARSATLDVLYSFSGRPDGEFPSAGLAIDPAGNLYGTTSLGGFNGYGSLYRLSPNGVGGYGATILVDLTLNTGIQPSSALTLDAAGNIYGTTYNAGPPTSYGTVFRLSPDGGGGFATTILHGFTGSGGGQPIPGVTLGADGNLYGTTWAGGANSVGTVYRLPASGGSATVLHSFAGPPNGDSPAGGIVRDPAGNLYGTTRTGGANNLGTVFRLSPDGLGGYGFTTLHSFTGSDGRYPVAGLTLDAAGNLFGTTEFGGANTFGTVFRLSGNGGGGYAATVLHSFDGTNGRNPTTSLLMDTVGNLFGTTRLGGPTGVGTIYSLTPAGGDNYTAATLYSFDYSAGAFPLGDLISDSVGNLYGTAYSSGQGGFGTVYRLSGSGFVVAEQSTDVPEPGTLALIASAVLVLAAHHLQSWPARRRRGGHPAPLPA